MATALHVSHVAKAFGGVPVLRDISFDLHPGELTVLAGENGAGKSTLMKIITGQLRADAGAVSVDGAGTAARRPQVRARPRGGHRAAGTGALPGDDHLREPVRGTGDSHQVRHPRPPRDGQAGPRDARDLRCRGRREDPDGQPADRPGPTRRDRQGHHLGREGAAARRADLGDPRPRGRAALRGGAHPQAAGRGDALHHPPDGRDLRTRRPGRRAARRPVGTGRSAGRHHAGRHRARDDRPRTRQPLSRDHRGRRRDRSDRAGSAASRGWPGRGPRRPQGRDPRAGRPGRRGSHARSWRPSSGSGARSPEPSTSTALPCVADTWASRSRPASRWFPRIARAPGWC